MTKATISFKRSKRVKKMARQFTAKAMEKPTIQLTFNCLTSKVTRVMVMANKMIWNQYLPPKLMFRMCLARKYCRKAVVACTKRLVQAAPTE